MSIYKFSRRAIFGLVLSILAGISAYAQSTILVVDTQRVIRRSLRVKRQKLYEVTQACKRSSGH